MRFWSSSIRFTTKPSVCAPVAYSFLWRPNIDSTPKLCYAVADLDSARGSVPSRLPAREHPPTYAPGSAARALSASGTRRIVEHKPILDPSGGRLPRVTNPDRIAHGSNLPPIDFLATCRLDRGKEQVRPVTLARWRYSAAVAMSHQLARARLLTVDGYGHTSGASACADRYKTRYLIDGTLPPRAAKCAQDKPPFTG